MKPADRVPRHDPHLINKDLTRYEDNKCVED